METRPFTRKACLAQTEEFMTRRWRFFGDAYGQDITGRKSSATEEAAWRAEDPGFGKRLGRNQRANCGGNRFPGGGDNQRGCGGDAWISRRAARFTQRNAGG